LQMLLYNGDMLIAPAPFARGPPAVTVLAVPVLVFGVDGISVELASSLTSYWRSPSNPRAFRRRLIEDSLRKF
jgi:hypothetical protein